LPQLNIASIIPFYKRCRICSHILFHPLRIQDQYYFYCNFCKDYTKWTDKTLLHHSKISFSVLEKLILCYIRNKSIKDILESLKEHFPTNSLAKNTVLHYMDIFNQTAVHYYKTKLNTITFNGHVEIDETFLFKMKKTKAKHRTYSRSLWLFGIIQREDHQFVIIPTYSRDESTLLPLMLKHIKIGATIYSDCFSTYVNNHVLPKKSKLEEYGYQHQWINHKVEFVSALFDHIHTNNIERLWLKLKTDFKRKNIKKINLYHIARFYFHSTLEEREQINLIGKGLKEKLH